RACRAAEPRIPAPVRAGSWQRRDEPSFRPMRPRFFLLVAALLSLPPLSSALADDAPSRVRELEDEAKALAPLVHTALARAFLAAVPRLPSISPRTVYRDSARTRAWSAREAQQLPDTLRAKLVARTLDERFYYDTRYGSPLAYVRALEILGRHG